MMKIINQIYWDRINTGYMAGTSLKKNSNEEIKFKNELMPAGKTIMKWSSSLNYQAHKEVPRLPILLSGKSYRLVMDLDIVPSNTAIFRLRFFDLQTNEIDKIIFSAKEKVFVYPPDAVSYTFEIINGGCSEIDFRRIQIGEENLPKEAFADFYPNIINQAENNKKVGLLLVADSKRARELEQVLVVNSIDSDLIIGYLSWQKGKSQVEELAKFLNHYQDQELTIFSSSENVDQFLQNNQDNLTKQNKVVFAKELMTYPANTQENQWFKSAVNTINLQDAVNQTIDYFRE